MKIQFALIESAYERHLVPGPFSSRQIEKYGLRSIAETAIRDVGDLRTMFCDDEIDKLIAHFAATEPVEIID